MINNKCDILAQIRYLNRCLEKQLNKGLELEGLTYQQGHAVFFIKRKTNEGAIIHQSDLEDHLNLGKSTISELVKRLTNNGFISKGTSSDSYALFLTEKGENVIQTFKDERDKLKQKLLSGINDKELQLFKETIEVMIENIKGDDIPCGKK